MVSGSGVIAVVPARGGSKSIPRKNIRPLNGVPLLAYSIEAGLSAGLVDRVIVSTDDREIAEVARSFGAEVPFLRPDCLAGDATPDLPVFQHVLDWLHTHEGTVPDIVVQLRPTSPLRPPDCIDRAIDLLRSHPTADSVRGVVRTSQNPYKMWRIQPDGAMAPLLAGEGVEPFNSPRQELPTTYWQTGHVDAIRTATILRQRSMTGSRILPLVIDPAYTCDIDDERDWRITELALERFHQSMVVPRSHAGTQAGTQAGLPEDLRLIVFDFDGVMTDNRVWTAQDGEEWVACSRSDGLGITLLRQHGIDALVLSTEENPVVGRRCAKLGLPFEQSVPDKGRRLRALLAERGIAPSQVVYVGNDVNDLECMRLCGCAVAVADAHRDVLREADLVLDSRGGHGAVRELCDRVTSQRRQAGSLNG